MNITIKQVHGISFVGKGETNHWVSIDGPKEFGGAEAGSRPKELLLIALGCCTGSDVVSILQKKKVLLQSMDINIDAEVSEQIPKVFTSINLEYIFHGADLNTNDLERAIDLSQNKYCPISAMLQKACPIHYSYKVIGLKNKS